ncbi:hypothetical protein B4135_3910 [Caldibacillus debilis]|uniref:Uncharacterized protein n=1 Tax=Caldibacillus debilis TaxID=301148 RepID=A0A150LAG2_9BACI|nr:hypothetical protein B4135_3910 [Caldibacillus debilis]
MPFLPRRLFGHGGRPETVPGPDRQATPYPFPARFSQQGVGSFPETVTAGAGHYRIIIGHSGTRGFPFG